MRAVPYLQGHAHARTGRVRATRGSDAQAPNCSARRRDHRAFTDAPRSRRRITRARDAECDARTAASNASADPVREHVASSCSRRRAQCSAAAYRY